VALRSEKLLYPGWLQRWFVCELFRSECAPGRRYLVNNYVSESDEQPSADLGPQVNQAAIVENKRLASYALCFDSGMARGATDAIIAGADDGFILPRGFDQRHLAIRRYRIATDRSCVNLRRSPHHKVLRLL
jgi:hypothetical protein